MLTCEILSVTPTVTDTVVRYACYDGEDTATISFVDNISVPAACFHSERSGQQDAFGQMCRHIDEHGTNAVVGSEFVSE